MLSAEELHRRGVSAVNRGRIIEGRGLLERARGRSADPDLQARIDATLAYVRAEGGDSDAAVAACTEILARPEVSGEVVAVVSVQVALLRMRRGETTLALEAFGAAIGGLVDPADLGKAHANRGNVFLQQGRASDAVADFAAAADLLAEAGLDMNAAMARHNLGYAHLLTGDLVSALDEMARARVDLADVSPVVRAIGDQDRAEALMAAGLESEGRAALAEAARAYASRRLHQRRGEAELTLARSLVVTDPARALDAARRARRLFRRIASEAWRVRAEGVALTAEVALGRTAPSLVVRGREVAGELEDQGLHWGAVTATLDTARVLVRRGDVDGARALLARSRVDARAPLAVRLRARDVRAELAGRQGRRSAALDHLRAGLSDLHAWQSSFGSLDLQTMVAGQGRRLGVRGLALAVESGRPEVLFEWSERARMLASRVQPVRAPQDEEIAADLAVLRGLAQPADGPLTAPAADEALLRRRVRERAWQHRGSGEVADPATLADLQGSLGGDTALVAHVVTAQRVVALVVTAAGARCHDLGPRADLDALLGGLLPDLDVAAADLPASMAGLVRAELARRLSDLADRVVTPVLADLGERRVVLTPSGVLAGVPWTLLPGLTGRPVTVAPSATAWLERRATPLRTTSVGFVAGPDVARAEEEVLEAAQAWPAASVLTGAAARAAAVSELAERVDVLHVAAHGRHSAENPMFSGFRLADGPWYGYDIDQLRAVPDVVLLSACEVGRSSVRAGEELIGMTAAWLHAGTRCVVASAAAVSDEAAYAVLVQVHAALAAGRDPASALAATVGAVGPEAAPTPFVCFGNGW